MQTIDWKQVIKEGVGYGEIKIQETGNFVRKLLRHVKTTSLYSMPLN